MENVKDTLRNYILEHFQIEADDPDFGDDVHLFVGSDKRRIRAIPWSSLDIESAGLKDPKSGADLKMTLGNTSVRVRLFTPFVCIPHFDNVLAVILTHIQENAKAAQKGEKRLCTGEKCSSMVDGSIHVQKDMTDPGQHTFH